MNIAELHRIFRFWLFIGVAGLTGFLFRQYLHTDDPEGKVLIALLVSAIVALLLAFWGKDLIPRLSKFGPSGIEFEVWQKVARLPELAELPRPTAGSAQYAWGSLKLTNKQSWNYEVGSSLLIYLSHSGVKAEELAGRDLDRYRRLVVWVGIVALSERADSKALDILRSIEHLRDPNYDELFFLGQAYMLVARDETDQDSRTDKLDRSAELLERAVKARPNQAHGHWTLGYVYYHLEMHPQSIEENKLAIKEDSKFLPWASWMQAASHLKLNDQDAALDALEKIGPGDWWGEIWEDEDLEELQDDLRFQSLVGTGLFD